MSRRLARETALKVLYQIDMTGEISEMDKNIEYWAGEFNLPEKHQPFTKQLIEGTLSKKEEIDHMIGQNAHEWALDRMSVVDRNLMRLASYEMLYLRNTPQRVSLNEAIELAKKFGGDDSAKFINGILDNLMTQEEKEWIKQGKKKG
ncbi:NusB antitermination factor [Syntrophobotulus glycolicus DSM 8271]|uniref:Transcription antitermination protein NusB n=1 Tax=Syntrophobotulus glycolicus (strain DSM 8271 / FlGlyR) TaxID=645991 RepID=F0T0R2_SYNGF|nr:transcription antitermination factor NusB [Syntrophobotulus glycolicus]ADY56201.1 NusB antitermination factor [Syntrophobotulus glycolicus DSM 8271]